MINSALRDKPTLEGLGLTLFKEKKKTIDWIVKEKTYMGKRQKAGYHGVLWCFDSLFFLL